MMAKNRMALMGLSACILMGCNQRDPKPDVVSAPMDFKSTPENKTDRDMPVFSDQGAWFAHGLPKDTHAHQGFSGSFPMTQENGVWGSPNWLDQPNFGVKGLKNHHFEAKAHLATKKQLEGTQGILGKGLPIYENYHFLPEKGSMPKILVGVQPIV